MTEDSANNINISRGEILLGNYLFNAYDVEVTPHSADFEYFESYDGVISIRKQLDKHIELNFKTMLTEHKLESYVYDSQKIYDPEESRGDFIELRRKFLDQIDGELVLVASSMFKPFKGVVSARSYNIPAGESVAEFDIEVKEVS